MSLEEKEKEIQGLLEEMKLTKVIEAGFSDLYVEVVLKSKHKEDVERWGSVGGFKAIVIDKVDKTSIQIFTDRLKDICLSKTFVQDGILNITYDNKREICFDINFISKIYAMRKGDSNVY